jgi:hypothetical protein
VVETELSWVVSEAMDEPEPPWHALQSCADFRPARPSPGSERTTARRPWNQDNRKHSSSTLPVESPFVVACRTPAPISSKEHCPVPAALRLQAPQPRVTRPLAGGEVDERRDRGERPWRRGSGRTPRFGRNPVPCKAPRPPAGVVQSPGPRGCNQLPELLLPEIAAPWWPNRAGGGAGWSTSSSPHRCSGCNGGSLHRRR